MRVLITGSRGMVAQAAARHCDSEGDNVTALSRAELDIADAEQVRDTIAGGAFDAVINCAAYTDVDGAETSVEACYAANTIGVENLALASRLGGAAFVTISTDFVFNGEFAGFYTQRETPDPRSVYARSKLDGEDRARAANAASIIVRSGWIYGIGGTNFLSVMPQLLGEGKAINAIGDSYGTPTSAADLASRLRDLARLNIPGVYHAANSGSGTTYADFAITVCEMTGSDRSLVNVVSYKTLQRPAPRPVSSKLACLISEKLGLPKMPEWKTALEIYLTAQNGL